MKITPTNWLYVDLQPPFYTLRARSSISVHWDTLVQWGHSVANAQSPRILWPRGKSFKLIYFSFGAYQTVNYSWYGDRVNKQFWHHLFVTAAILIYPNRKGEFDKPRLSAAWRSSPKGIFFYHSIVLYYCFYIVKIIWSNYFLCNDMSKYLPYVVPVLFWKPNISWRLVVPPVT